MSSKEAFPDRNSQGPPPSPWFQKYGGQARNVLNKPHGAFRHSGVAPFFPQLHPTYYAEENAAFSHMAPYPQPSDYELDMLFGTEEAQIGLNAGLATWETGILREYLVNGWPGGHRQTDQVMPHILEHGFGVNVDERNWHPVFAKDRWYDLRLPIADGTFFPRAPPGINPSDVWSVDVQRVWEELRVSLELANRWLRHMAKGLWLNNMFNEQWVEWMEAEPLPFELDEPSLLGPNLKPWKIAVKNKDYDSEKTLKDIAEQLAPKLMWTFVDDGHHPYDAADNMDFYGRTVRHWNDGQEPTEDTPVAERKLPFLTIYIHVQPLRVLLNPQSTLSERCHSRWSMAMTVGCPWLSDYRECTNVLE